MNSSLLPLFDSIADGLAEQGFAIADNFLSAQEVTDILQTDGFKNGLLHFRQAGIGKQQEKQINESIRGDYIQWIDRTQAPAPVTVYLQHLQALIGHVTKCIKPFTRWAHSTSGISISLRRMIIENFL